MISDHMIEKAAEASIGMRLEGMHPEDAAYARGTAQKVLEAVAADIWEQGFKEGCDHGYDLRMAENWNDEYPPEPANPYRPSETA